MLCERWLYKEGMKIIDFVKMRSERCCFWFFEIADHISLRLNFLNESTILTLKRVAKMPFKHVVRYLPHIPLTLRSWDSIYKLYP